MPVLGNLIAMGFRPFLGFCVIDANAENLFDSITPANHDCHITLLSAPARRPTLKSRRPSAYTKETVSLIAVKPQVQAPCHQNEWLVQSQALLITE